MLAFDQAGDNEATTTLLELRDRAMLGQAAEPATILYHYPAAKLGLRSSIRFCADRMTEAAHTILGGFSDGTPWVITSPPRFVLEAAANRFAAQIASRLLQESAFAVTHAEMRLRAVAGDTSQMTATHLYSQSGLATRLQDRAAMHERLQPLSAAQFQGSAVLFINDIHVTGAQQHYMRQALQQAGVARIHWLYLVTVPRALGHAHPQIEYELNYARFADLKEFLDLLAMPDLEPTARCINRLFDLDEPELHACLVAMSASRRAFLLELALEECQYQGRAADYQDKLCRLAQAFA